MRGIYTAYGSTLFARTQLAIVSVIHVHSPQKPLFSYVLLLFFSLWKDIVYSTGFDIISTKQVNFRLFSLLLFLTGYAMIRLQTTNPADAENKQKR